MEDVIVTNRITLKAIARRYDFKIDEKFSYIIDYDFGLHFKEIIYKDNKYKIKYFDGCIYPYLVKVK